MYLKALEIQGFKSFPDRTRLEFTRGMTAVVGPNGSGKSNISDAVRWVLGEQSTKTLRGAKMEDVIFGGTQQRKAMGSAQVTLYIDNSDGSMDMDAAEVSVTRKLYRSGESEYKINEQNVRLKDVYELFMDTGLGRDGYSIIGQGRIAEIVGAKSGNRREIFEEAAGISKFRYRKTEAERKLLAAQENLLRLKDIMAELESRVGPLRVQAEKASAFVKLAEQRKTLELSIWVAELEKTRVTLRQQEDKVSQSQSMHAAVEEELAAVEAAAEEAFQQISKCTVEIDALRTAIREKEEGAAQAQSQIAVLGNDIFHNNESIRRVQAEIAEQTGAGEDIRAQLAQHEQELARMAEHTEALRGQAARAEGETAAFLEALAQEAEGVEQARVQVTAAAAKLSEAKVNAVTAQAARTEVQNRIHVLGQSGAQQEQKERELTDELQNCTELLASIAENLESLQNTESGLQLKLKGRTERRAAVEEEIRSIEAKANEKLQRAHILQGLEQNMEGFSGSVKYIVGQAQQGKLRGVHGAVSKLIEVDEKYSLAVETALGAGLQNIVVDNDEAAKHCIQMLKESKSGRATFLPIGSIRGGRLSENGLAQRQGYVALACELVRCKDVYKNVIDSLLGRVVVAEDLNDAVLMARAHGSRFRVVTLDGQVVNVGGSMTGGSTQRSAGLLSRQSEIERLTAQAEEIRRGGEELRGKHKALSEELSALGAQLLAVTSEQRTANEDNIRYEAEQKRLRIALEDLVRDRADGAGQLERLTKRLAELEQGIETSVRAVGECEEASAAAQRTLTERTERHETKRHEREALSAERARLEMELLARTKDMEGVRRQMEALSERGESQSQRIETHRAEIERLTACNAEITAQITQLEQQRAAAMQETALAQQEIAALGERRTACEQRSTQIRAQEKEISARKEQLARELARVEEKKFSLQSEYDAVIARMWDEYEMTRSEAEAAATPVEDMTKAQRTLGEIKGKIKALGTVNLEAIEEYEQVSTRYEFMRKQIGDVEKSRDQLHKIIHDLTAQMREMFTTSFRQINDNFAHIFVELFGGGRASLTLTDESDVLESGIEINVQPPGKLIKNLASLSGGEQAFVAIAIYFAILKVRPAPFCLLDEIEAALDDVNVTKYAQYLKRLGGKTQFIAITHRRGTMEEADVLYGVTMQEEGVSKLLQLSVTELAGRLGIGETPA